MLSATLAVAAIASGVLFAGTRIFGAADPASASSIGRAGIGAPAGVVLDGHTSPVPGPSLATSSDSGPLTANQPALPAASSAKPSTAQTSPTKTTAATANAGPEAQVVTLVNTERANAGCGALTVDSRLTTAARGHSSDMATRNYFSHDTPEGVTVGTRITNTGYKWSMVGENIAWGQATAAAVMKDWMNSAGHKANILNCGYKNIGVGLAYDTNRRPYWTQDFGTLM